MAWRVLPPVGGEPANRITGREHLSSRILPAAVAVDDRVLLWGGRDQFRSDDLGRARKEELDTGLTIDTEGAIAARWTLEWHWGDAAVLIDGQVAVVGPGSTGRQRALVFDPEAPESAVAISGPLAGRRQAICSQDTMVVWGGEVGSEPVPRGDGLPASDGAAFHAPTCSWSLLPPAPIGPRADHVLEAVGDDVVVWGGRWWGEPSKAGPLGDGAVYSLASRQWRSMSSSPLSARSRASSVTVGRRVFIWSGFGGASNAYRGDGAMYDPEGDTWTTVAEAPVRKPGAVVATVGSLVLLSGGTHVGGADVRLLIYDASSDAWAVPELDGFTPGPASYAPLSNGDLYAWSFVDPTTEHAILSGLKGFETISRHTVLAREARPLSNTGRAERGEEGSP